MTNTTPEQTPKVESETQPTWPLWLFGGYFLIIVSVGMVAGQLSGPLLAVGVIGSIYSFGASYLITMFSPSPRGIGFALLVAMGIPLFVLEASCQGMAGKYWDAQFAGIVFMVTLGVTAIPCVSGIFWGLGLSTKEPPNKTPADQGGTPEQNAILEESPVDGAQSIETSESDSVMGAESSLEMERKAAGPEQDHALAHPIPFPFSSSIFLSLITLIMVLCACLPFSKGVIGTTASLNSAPDSFRFWVYGLMALQLLAPLTFSRLGVLLPYGCIALGLAFNIQYGLLFEPFQTSAYFNYVHFILVAHGLVATAFALPYLWPRIQSRMNVVESWAYDALRQSVQSLDHSYLDEVKPQETGLRLHILHPNGSEEQRGEVDVMFAGDVEHFRLHCRFPITPLSDQPIVVHPKRVGLPGINDFFRRQKTGHRILDHFFVCTGDAKAIKELAALENMLLKLMHLSPHMRIDNDQLVIHCPFIQKDEMDWTVVLDTATALWKDLDHMGQGLGATLPQEKPENQTASPERLPLRPLGFSKNWLIVYAMILLISPLVLNHQQSEVKVLKHRVSIGDEEKERWPDPQYIQSMDSLGRPQALNVAPCMALLPSYICSGDVLPLGLKEGDTLALGKKSGGKRDGQWTYWWRYPDIKWQEGVYDNGQPVGLWTRWDSNGAFKAKTMWISHEEAVLQYPDKERRRERSVKDSLHQEWYERGQMKLNGHFADNQRTDLWRTWYANGQKESEGRYEPVGKKEQKVGPWSYWDQEGKLIKEEFYKDGELVLDDAQ